MKSFPPLAQAASGNSATRLAADQTGNVSVLPGCTHRGHLWFGPANHINVAVFGRSVIEYGLQIANLVQRLAGDCRDDRSDRNLARQGTVLCNTKHHHAKIGPLELAEIPVAGNRPEHQ